MSAAASPRHHRPSRRAGRRPCVSREAVHGERAAEAGAPGARAAGATGETVVIFGAGGVGLNAVSGARIAGASRIVVIDVQPKRLDAAQHFGATDVVDSSTTDPVAVIRGLFPRGVDHVFDFVGLKAVAEQGLAMLAVGGGLSLVGD